jgi:hypothetical protein
MLRSIGLLVLGLLVVVAPGASHLDVDDCGDCPDQAPPGCQDCACCATIGPMLAPGVLPDSSFQLVRLLAPEAVRRPLPPLPREVFHVPKTTLA